jgi:subtilisin family serine protease
VAVVEQGFDIGHPDLIDNIFINEGELPTQFTKSTADGKLVDCNDDGIITFADLNCKNCTRTSAGKTPQETCLASYEAARNEACSANSATCIPSGPVTPRVLIKSLKDGDSDGNGFSDDIIGWDFSNNDNDPSIHFPADTKSDLSANHGTAVAGIIGASTNNGVNVSGTAWGVRLLLIRTESWAESRNAFRYVTDKLHADVINYSRGDLYLVGASPQLPGQPQGATCPATLDNLSQQTIDAKSRSMIDDFKSLNLNSTLLVSAVSNCPLDIDKPGILDWPSEAPSDSIIAVTTGSTRNAFGAMSVDVAGLGGPGMTLVNQDVGATSESQVDFDSTSFATAYTSGVAVLVMSAFPDLRGKPACLADLLRRNGEGTINSVIRGSNRLNMYDAVTNLKSGSPGPGCPR